MTTPALPDSLTNAAEYTVSEISVALKRTVEDAFGHVRVRGEISGYRGPHSSGHAYFALKDERSRLEAVVWRGTFGKLRFKPEEGMEVIATGRLTTYPGSSKYQIVIDNIEPAGAGALMALLEERKRKLAAEGLFDAARKRRLPYMPRVVGVVTSPTGAVIRDIIHRITDRFPLHVIVWPIRVQGETSGREAADAVAGFNAMSEGGPVARPDVIIVARGGGSLEDLWGFNDEALARAVAASTIPVISAVGHETDWTLVDLAADLRAPTPTGAAELAVPVKAELEATLAALAARLRGCVGRSTDRKREALRALARALPSADQLLAMPRRRFDEAAGRLGRALGENTARKRARFAGLRLRPDTLLRRFADARLRLDRTAQRLPACHARLVEDRRRALRASAARLSWRPIDNRVRAGRVSLERDLRRLDNALGARLERHRAALAQVERLMATLSYESVLQRGYVVVRDEEGRVVSRAGAVRSGTALELQFADDRVTAVAGSAPARPKSAVSPKGPDERQGSLL
ncbi:MAG: exodeoxyribonuclease VII large subunit [Rhizobiaceae bacterium]|nr:exodeoxyribonuclease VII large subunit [Rhizobiaceae bacterium]